MKQLYRFCSLYVVLILYTGISLLSQKVIREDENILITTYCDNWKTFCHKFQSHKNNPGTKLPILFIGDSHIQGGYFTNRFRNLFLEQGIIAGRGFTFPHTFAQTNGPEDMQFNSSARWECKKWDNTANCINSPFGYILSTKDTLFNFAFTFKSRQQVYPFQKIIFFHSNCNFRITSNEPIVETKKGVLSKDINFTEIQFCKTFDSCQITIHVTSGDFTLYSLYTENLAETLPISAIGINGISYQQYNEKIDLDLWLSYIHPACIIIALGTNDVFTGIKDSGKILKAIKELVHKINQILPETVIILTTPNDHLRKKKYTNPSLPQLNAILKKVAYEERCAYWDFFTVMGGLGSAHNWYSKKLLFRDFVHLSKTGYKLQGEIFFEAFQNALNQPDL